MATAALECATATNLTLVPTVTPSVPKATTLLSPTTTNNQPIHKLYTPLHYLETAAAALLPMELNVGILYFTIQIRHLAM